MIRLNDQWSFFRDPYQWILVEHYMGKDGKGNPKEHTKETYHPWLDQAMRYAAAHSCQNAKTFKDIEKRYHELQEAITGCARALELEAHPVAERILELETKLRSAERRLKEAA